MRIIDCYIKGFGRLSEVRYDFSPGLNAMLSGNGRGKSTLAAFLQAMLYGLSDTKKASLDENDRRRYAPWSGGAFGGTLTIEARGKKYRIEREFGRQASKDSFTLLDATSGRPSSDFSERLGEELFGIDADGFLRTVFLSEKVLSEKNENRSIGAKLSGLSGVDADMGEVDVALGVLEERRKFYYKKGGAGVISDMHEQTARLENEIEALGAKEKALSAREDELAALRSRIAALKKESAELDGRLSDARVNERLRGYEEHYAELGRSLEADMTRLGELQSFFKSGVPTHKELDTLGALSTELSMSGTSDAEHGDPELTELRAVFDGRTSREELEEIEEISRSVRASRRGFRRVIAVLLILLGGVGVASGAALGITPLYASAVMSAVGAVMLLTSGRTKNRERRLREFLSGFPCVKELCPKAAVAELKKKYARYESLLLLKDRLGAGVSQVMERKDEIKARLDGFLHRYPTVSAEPLAEIRRALTELEALEESIERKKRELGGRSAPSAKGDSYLSALELGERRSKLADNISALESEAAMKARALETDRKDAERLDALTARRDALADEIARCSENLDIIQKTKRYLTEAGERLTSRYLGKTKEGFDRYVSAIGGRETSSVLDTSLTLTHYEGAGAHRTESYSRGTRELYALCVRLSLTDALFGDEQPFIILDDPFSSFDDEALERAKATVRQLARERQIIYFTCSSARAL